MAAMLCRINGLQRFCSWRQVYCYSESPLRALHKSVAGCTCLPFNFGFRKRGWKTHLAQHAAAHLESLERGASMYMVRRCFFKDQKWPNSSLERSPGSLNEKGKALIE